MSSSLCIFHEGGGLSAQVATLSACTWLPVCAYRDVYEGCGGKDLFCGGGEKRKLDFLH